MSNNKQLNFECICGRLLGKKTRLIMCLPCEHILHEKCIKHKEFCPLCDVEIKSHFKLTNKLKTKEDHQRYSDILSVTNFCDCSSYSVPGAIDNIMNLGYLLGYLSNSEGKNDMQHMLDNLFSLNKTDIYVRGLERINNRDPKVFIATHTSYNDFLIIPKYINTYFLASDYINQVAVGRMILKVSPVITFKRNTGSNTVDVMKKFIKSHGSICLFPEGAMTHPETIIKFRTGAFHLGYPIYPIVIRYESPMTDFDITNHALKLISQKKTVIYMDILGPYYPPFSKDDIENIRKDMAKVGNMLLSRVSSKDVSEKTN